MAGNLGFAVLFIAINILTRQREWMFEIPFPCQSSESGWDRMTQEWATDPLYVLTFEFLPWLTLIYFLFTWTCFLRISDRGRRTHRLKYLGAAFPLSIAYSLWIFVLMTYHPCHGL